MLWGKRARSGESKTSKFWTGDCREADGLPLLFLLIRIKLALASGVIHEGNKVSYLSMNVTHGV
jgi:hypothetical protein